MATESDITHLLRRTEFVARPARVSALVPQSYEAAVDDVLNVTTTNVAIPAEISYHDSGGSYDQFRRAVQWWFDRMAFDSPRPIQEKMAFFWHGLFTFERSKTNHTGWMMEQNKLFRDRALGNFRDLCHTMALQPAMLDYLDNRENRRSSPNQNFARELLELFVLGVGNYTEDDVEAATRAWTGHTINRDTDTYEFRADWHDNGSKNFMGRIGNWDGPDIIDLLLDPGTTVTQGSNSGLQARVVAARFLTKKLWERFAYQGPSSSIVNSIADVLVANDFEVKPWVRAMLTHSAFRSSTAREGLVRPPVEFVAALLYHSGLRAAAVNPEWASDDMGQQMFGPPNVAGWKVNGTWVNASAMAARASFASRIRWRLADGRDNDDPSSMLTVQAGSWSWGSLDDLTSGQLIDRFAGAFDLSLSSRTRNALITWCDGERTRWGPRWSRSTNALLLTMTSPEMNLA